MRTTGRNCAESHAERVVYIVFGSNGNTHLGKHKDKKTCESFFIVLLCIISLIGDWMFMNVLGVLFLHVFRENPKKKWIAFTAVYLLPNAIMVTISALMGGSRGFAGSWFFLGVILVPPLLYFSYNGKSGSNATIHKWLFYVFYPLHLLILGLLA